MSYSTVQFHPGVQTVQCLQTETFFEMPVWTQLPGFAYPQTAAIYPIVPPNHVEPYPAPSRLDAGQQQTTSNQRDVEDARQAERRGRPSKQGAAYVSPWRLPPALHTLHGRQAERRGLLSKEAGYVSPLRLPPTLHNFHARQGTTFLQGSRLRIPSRAPGGALSSPSGNADAIDIEGDKTMTLVASV